MNRFICIHGHFYQPPRENPWLEFVELQDSAYPYHDWNSRITAESYAPNTASRIITRDSKIIDLVNNYSKISFNFGPTLLSWLKSRKEDVYKAILKADEISRENFSGHGSAIAQCYSHMIMPLASSKDKRTQVIWGIKDFEHHFSRYPEGMWLPETAVDLQTLDIMAEMGIKFTILAPSQASRVKDGSGQWVDVKKSNIDPKQPYRINLPSGRQIAVFFYDGPISNDVGFKNILDNGENFAKRLVSSFSESEESQLVNIATDGETYGHHHRFGEMALSYCLHYIEENNLARITNYGEYLENHPPLREAEIFEQSSWSCSHGVLRWKDNCGCGTGAHPQWHQKWRKPLREAMDWLSQKAEEVFQDRGSSYFSDPWEARDRYIEVVLDRNKDNTEKFLGENCLKELESEEKVTALKLLEMQRHSMLIFTSCGWFFDDISGIETIQVMMYAARCMQLVKELGGADLESEFTGKLEKASSNKSEFGNGALIYSNIVKPAVLDLLRVGVNYAISSIFEKYPEDTRIYCFGVQSHIYDKIRMGRQKLAVGRATLISDITWEQATLKFAVLHLGDHNLIGGIHPNGQQPFEPIHKQIKESFIKSDIPLTISLMDRHFGSHNYSLWHLFKDKQREIIYKVNKPSLKEIEQSCRQIYEHNYPVMQAMIQMGVPLPEPFENTLKFILQTDLVNILEDKRAKLRKLAKLVEEIRRWPISLDKRLINFVAANTISRMMKKFYSAPRDIAFMDAILSLLKLLKPLELEYDLWEAQNLYFYLSRDIYPQMLKKAEQGDINARQWISSFREIDSYMPARSL